MRYFLFTKKHTLYAGLLILFGLTSCYDHDRSLEEDSTNKASNAGTVESVYDQKSNLKREFGKALIQAMKESQMLRDLLKTEALKMFNKEYDVLYLLIKDKRLENTSVEELMVKHLGGKEKLDEIISQNPTLTILVPELPNESFSAELWDTQNEVPAVAIRTSTSNDVPFITADGTEDVIPGKYTPAFPILVLKENERVIASTSNARSYKQFSQLKTREVYNRDGLTLKLWDNAFDHSIKSPVETKRAARYTDSKVREAYNIYKHANGWHRDYIYYNITPSNPNGEYRDYYKEHITSFSMVGDPIGAYIKISDQVEDPKAHTFSNSPSSFWTDGKFDFKVIANVNSKNAGAQITSSFSVDPTDIFSFTYICAGEGGLRICAITDVSLKTMSLSVPLFSWKLEEYSPTVKFSFEEIDLSETHTITESRTMQYAANFSINPKTGFLEKIGLKFGAKRTEKQTQTYQIIYKKENDFLGEAIVDFSNKVLLGDGTITREYRTGYYKFTLEPRRVQY